MTETTKGSCADAPLCFSRDQETQELIQDFRGLASSGLPRSELKARCIALGKQIQRTISRKRVEFQTDKTQVVLSEGRGLKRLFGLLAPPKSNHIVEIRDKHGSTLHDDITEVFASFYEDSYKLHSHTRSDDTYRVSGTKATPPFTQAELASALKQTKAGKAHDASGICAEMVTIDCPELCKLIVEVFNDVLKAGQSPPHNRRSSRLVSCSRRATPCYHQIIEQLQ